LRVKLYCPSPFQPGLMPRKFLSRISEQKRRIN
jgi:hypothetical protein